MGSRKKFFFLEMNLAKTLRSLGSVVPRVCLRSFGASARVLGEEVPAHMQRPYYKPGSELDPMLEDVKDPNIQEISKQTGIPADHLVDPHLQFWTSRAEALLDRMNVPDSEREAFLEKNILSPGQFTLEWCLPSPPPVHGFMEPPVIKETE